MKKNFNISDGANVPSGNVTFADACREGGEKAREGEGMGENTIRRTGIYSTGHEIREIVTAESSRGNVSSSSSA